MHPLEQHARPLLEREDIEGLTRLLETWQPRDEFWLQCVDSRRRAPSSTPDQKRRLRALYLSAAPDFPPPPSFKELAKAYAEADARAAQDADALERALAADELCLPELAAAFGLAQDIAATLPPHWAEPAHRIITQLHQSSLQAQAKRREQYAEELRSRRPPLDTTLERIRSELTRACVRLGPPATPDELDQIEALIGQPLDDELRAFYRCIGGIGADLDGVLVSLPPPSQLIAAHHSPDRWQQMRAPSLFDMALSSWGNDHLGLDPENLPTDTVDVARRTLCIGWIRDGYCEEHAYVVRMPDGSYQLHSWHQDYRFGLPVPDVHRAPLLPLLQHAIGHLMAPRDPDGGPLDIPALIEALNGQPAEAS